jgi:hypothetical protein
MNNAPIAPGAVVLPDGWAITPFTRWFVWLVAERGLAAHPAQGHPHRQFDTEDGGDITSLPLPLPEESECAKPAARRDTCRNEQLLQFTKQA